MPLPSSPAAQPQPATWPEEVEKRSPDLEALRLASLYVDYDFNPGLWLDPSSLDSPEESGSLYSGAVYSGLVEIIGGGEVSHESREQTEILLGTERFNTFAYCILLKTLLDQAIDLTKSAAARIIGSSDVRREAFKALRMREYLEFDEVPPENRDKELMRPLANLTNVYSPGIAEQVAKEVREHFRTSPSKERD